ncbi:hypothetical protein [Okeania sp. SIO2B3]|uniref:hypothetical protein n=1 Tax=Okeania sp. SIO2B3 TaxID=2607784 RepID=UPI0013BEF60B|nr:hypothetical protein [Okeania sp. SIO2B3]NET42608.1 hypothetical protein [Okeania sp. SIO2B3]
MERLSKSGCCLARSELYLWCVSVVGKKNLISRVGLEIVAKFEYYKEQLQKDPN